jgi:hypothetical protein
LLVDINYEEGGWIDQAIASTLNISVLPQHGKLRQRQELGVEQQWQQLSLQIGHRANCGSEFYSLGSYALGYDAHQ